MKVWIILGLVIVYFSCSEAQRNRCRNIQCNINSGPVCANGRRFPNDCILRRSFCNRRQQFQLERCPAQEPRQPQRQQPWGQQNNQRRQPNFNQGRPNPGWNNQGRGNPGWNNQGYNQGYNPGYNQQWYPSRQGSWGQGFVDPEERQEALENQRENQQEMYENQQEMYENQWENQENERENQQEMYENQWENQEEGGMSMFQGSYPYNQYGGWYQNPNQNMGRYRGQQPRRRGNYYQQRRPIQQQQMWTSREQWNPMSPSRLVTDTDNDFMEPEELEFDGPLAQTAGGTTESQENSSEEMASPGGSPGASPGQSFSSPSDSVLSTGPFGSL